MRRNSSPSRMLPAFSLLLAAHLLWGTTPSLAAGSTRIDLGPLAGDLALPPGWVSAGTDLATKLLKRDGVREPPVLSFLKGENQVVFATTKVTEGVVLTAADLAGGGPELAKALGIAPAAIQCNAFPHPSGGFEFSICETIAAGTGLAVTGKGKPTAAIWVDIPLTYEGPGGVTNSWTSIYFRGPGAAMASGHEMVEALVDALTLKTGLRAVAAGTATAHGEPGSVPTPPAAAPAPSIPLPTAPAADGKRLADLLAGGLADQPTPMDIAALRSVSEAYSQTVLGEVAAELAKRAAAQLALSTWKELLAKSPGDAQLRSLALRFFGAALHTGDIETMRATARWMAERQLSLAQLQPEELTAVFPAGDLCPASRRDLPEPARGLGILDGNKNDSGGRLVDLFRGHGLTVPDVNMVAVADTGAVWRPKGDRTGAMPLVAVMEGRLGVLTPKDPAKVKAGYWFKPFTNVFDALERLCPAQR